MKKSLFLVLLPCILWGTENIIQNPGLKYGKLGFLPLQLSPDAHFDEIYLSISQEKIDGQTVNALNIDTNTRIEWTKNAGITTNNIGAVVELKRIVPPGKMIGLDFWARELEKTPNLFIGPVWQIEPAEVGLTPQWAFHSLRIKITENCRKIDFSTVKKHTENIQGKFALAEINVYLIEDVTPKAAIKPEKGTFDPAKEPCVFFIRMLNPEAISYWMIQIKDESGAFVSTSPRMTRVLSKLEWDGKRTDGQLADPEVAYTAQLVGLTVFGKTFKSNEVAISLARQKRDAKGRPVD